MISSIFLILAVAVFIPLLRGKWSLKVSYGLALLPFGLFMYFARQYGLVSESFPVQETLIWNPLFDLELAFYLDGLSLLFSLLITGIGTLIYLYAAHYMNGKPHQSRFFCFLTIFMASMLGLVLADNLLTIMVFWEMTSITSFMLIGFEHNSDKARSAAFKGLFVTSFGGLALLAGLVLMGQVSGTYTISEIVSGSVNLTEDGLYLPVLMLVLVGAFTKSAQVPFHFWLPSAMAAPTPVSAYLHSATMVKAGIYVIARFFPVLGGTMEWQLILSITGGITMLTGALMAFRSADLKQILAYSTISALGIMVMAFGIGTHTAIKAALAFIIAHALYKSTLFMVAGIVDKQTGERQVDKLPTSLYKTLKLPTAIAVLGALSLAGIIPFFGFIAKELLYKMAINSPYYSTAIIAGVVLTGAIFMAVTLVLTHRAFIIGNSNNSTSIKAASLWFSLPPLITALAGLFFGFFPGLPSGMIGLAQAGILKDAEPVHLALWHGVNLPLWLSIASIVLGIFIYRFYSSAKKHFKVPKRLTPTVAYENIIEGLYALARWQTAKLQTGYLRRYVFITVLVLLCLTGTAFITKAGFRLNLETIDMYIFESILGIILLAALVFILILRTEIGALLSLGIVAIVVSIIFLEYGAPDLAITWFLVDTLIVTLTVLIIHKLPLRVVPKKPIARYRDAIISIAIGLLMTSILFSITYDRLQSGLKEFYAANAYDEAKGKNIVNVILVDFRALDTFGEVTVLVIAALGVYALAMYSKGVSSSETKVETKAEEK